jgi:hypothetical protein
VALKRLTCRLGREIARARQPAAGGRRAARLDLPHVVGLDVIDEGGEIVLVMPYLPAAAWRAGGQHGPADR